MAENGTQLTKSAPKKAKKEKKKSRFFKEFWGEVKKLSWSSPKELVSNTLTVIAFVALFAVIIGVLDMVFGLGMKALINLG